jgi:hypothetical protein
MGCILILSSQLCLGLPSDLLSSGCPNKILTPMDATCPTHLIFFELIIQIIYGEEEQIMKLLIM